MGIPSRCGFHDSVVEDPFPVKHDFVSFTTLEPLKTKSLCLLPREVAIYARRTENFSLY